MVRRLGSKPSLAVPARRGRQSASLLLARCREVFRGLYRREPEVRAIHAGIECAIIGDTYPGMDMISFGPTTENAHSPAKRLQVPSRARIGEFLGVLLNSLAEK